MGTIYRQALSQSFGGRKTNTVARIVNFEKRMLLQSKLSSKNIFLNILLHKSMLTLMNGRFMFNTKQGGFFLFFFFSFLLFFSLQSRTFKKTLFCFLFICWFYLMYTCMFLLCCFSFIVRVFVQPCVSMFVCVMCVYLYALTKLVCWDFVFICCRCCYTVIILCKKDDKLMGYDMACLWLLCSWG